jgi:hypothetical protein
MRVRKQAIHAPELGGEPVAPWEEEAARHLVDSAHEVRLLGRLGIPQFRREVVDFCAEIACDRIPKRPLVERGPDLSDLATRLARLAIAIRQMNAPRASWYAARADELALEAALATATGSHASGALFARRYPGPSAAALALAKRWLADERAEIAPELEADCHSSGPDPSSLERQMLAALDQHGFRVEVRDDLLAYAATGENVVYVAQDRQLSRHAVARTVLHEVRGHVLPQIRARKTAIPLLRTGSAGARDAQEGWAILLEEQSGLLDSARRATLGARVVACDAMGAGASAVDVHKALLGAGVGTIAAAETTLRAFRGAYGTGRGLGRDYVYIEHFLHLRDAPPRLQAAMNVMQLGLDVARELFDPRAGSPFRAS